MAYTKISAGAPQSSDNYAVPARQFTFDQLADIYSQARVDYIVPMPMNGKRMAEYIHNYDVLLEGSFVSFNADKLETGVGMLGVRGHRGWITRLGVLPDRRGHHIGSFLMETMLDYALSSGIDYMQLEVILGNTPAHKLFLKLGFEEFRELLVIRRPPARAKTEAPQFSGVITPIAEADIPYVLATRTDTPTWLDENASLLNAGNLRGFQLTYAGKVQAWVIFQKQAFQLTHFAFGGAEHGEALAALMYHIHTEFAMQDTKIENLPADSPVWPVLQSVGYVEAFRRIEMFLRF